MPDQTWNKLKTQSISDKDRERMRMTDTIQNKLKADAEMLIGGHQDGLTELWHSEVVQDAAKDCVKAADHIDYLEAKVAELHRQSKLLRNHAIEEAAAVVFDMYPPSKEAVKAIRALKEKA